MEAITKNKRFLIIGGIAIFVLLCCVCPGIGALIDATSGEGEPPERVAVATVGALPTDEPTIAPEPTATLQPADTPTLQPTATPEPLPTNDPRADYLQEVGRLGVDMGDALAKIGELFQEPRFADNDWRLDTAIQLGIIRASHEQVATMDVPDSMAEFHAYLLSTTADCNEMTEHLADGLDNADVNEIEKAGELMLSCADKADSLSERLEAAVGQ